MKTTWQPDAGFWRDRPVAITGATGFLGSHVTDQLVGLGAQVAISVRDEVPRSPIATRWAHRVVAVRGAVEDYAAVERREPTVTLEDALAKAVGWYRAYLPTGAQHPSSSSKG